MNFGDLGAVGGGGFNPPAWALTPDMNIDIDFVNDRGFNMGSAIGSSASFFTCVRGGATAYAEDEAGNYISFNNNVLRRTNKGALIESQRTNNLRNSSVAGITPGSPGTFPTNFFLSGATTGLTQTISAATTENGIDCFDVRYNGTAGANLNFSIYFEAGNQIVAANGQTWVTSLFARLSAGASTNAVFLVETRGNDGAGTLQESTTTAFTIAGTSAALGLSRVSGNRTLNNVNTVRVNGGLNITVGNGLAVDFTVRIGWPQLERSDGQPSPATIMTSPIRTTGSALTRNTDVVTLNSFPPLVTANGFTFYNECMVTVKTASVLSFPRLLTANGSNSDQDTLGFATRDSFDPNVTTIQYVVGGSGALLTADPASTITLGVPFKVAARFVNGNINCAIQGNIGTTNAAIPNFTAPIVAVGLGLHSFFQNPSSIWYKRIGISLTQFTNARLQSITA